MSSHSAGSEPPTSLAFSPDNPTQSTQASMFQKVESVTTTVVSTLKVEHRLTQRRLSLISF